MPEYDLNVCAWQIIKVTANNEKEAVEDAFCEAFGRSRSHFATTKYELCGVSDRQPEDSPDSASLCG